MYKPHPQCSPLAMEGPDAPPRDEEVDRYIARKAEHFWGFGGALQNVGEDDWQMGKMVADRFEYQHWFWEQLIPGLRATELQEIWESGEYEDTEVFTDFSQMMVDLEEFDRSLFDRIKEAGDIDDYILPIGSDEVEDPKGIAFSDIPKWISDETVFIGSDFVNRASSTRADIMDAIRDDFERRPGEGTGEAPEDTPPVGRTLSAVTSRAREYLKVLKETIELQIRSVGEVYTETYTFLREEYFRATSGLFDEDERSVNELEFRIVTVREALISGDVAERAKRRAENTLFRYYYLKKFQRGSVEGIASLPTEIVQHIGGFSTKVWPDGFAEFELANSFEDYLRRKDMRIALQQDMAIYPEEQKRKLHKLSQMVEAVVKGVVETPADERRAFFEEHSAKVNAAENRMRDVLNGYGAIRRVLSKLFKGFRIFILKTTGDNPRRLVLQGRNLELNPVAPTERRLERMHIVIDTFDVKEAIRYVRRMLEENERAARVYLDDLKKQRIAIRDALVEGLKTKSPDARPRPAGMRARHMLDYGSTERAPSTLGARAVRPKKSFVF